MLDKLIQLLTAEGGVGRVRALITLGLTGAVISLFVQEKPVPDELLNAWFAVSGLYIGSRVAQSSANSK